MILSDEQLSTIGSSLGLDNPQANQSSQPDKIDVIAQSLGLTAKADYTNLIRKYFPQSEWDNAIKVMKAESGGKPDAVGDNFPIAGQTIPSYGLFQIRALPGRPDPKLLQNPEFNVWYASNMQREQGWKPWTTAVRMGLAN